MADDFDPARIGIQLDRAEECGAIETDVAEVLRGLVGGPIRMAVPMLLSTYMRPGGLVCELEWPDGSSAVTRDVMVTESDGTRHFSVGLAGRQFVFEVSR